MNYQIAKGIGIPGGLLLVWTLLTGVVVAAPISDIRNTKHNLSISGPGTVKATSESEICVFCHTPHGANTVPKGPLWNRNLNTVDTYVKYTSASADATELQGAWTIGDSSKLCLSCHDGTLAIGTVANAPGSGNLNTTISMSGTGASGEMPAGEGATTGFTRRLGTDLTNDHPISFTYNDDLALADGELRYPSTADHIGTRSPGVKPTVPLDSDKVECMSCHDPHIRDESLSVSSKFLRLNRFQEAAPVGGAFSETNDIICLACHDKLGQAWALSAHADPTTAGETYKSDPATLREFPADMPVWQAACLNCHDTHTIQGARRLLREGTDAASSTFTGGELKLRAGGNSAIESTCYQCHTTSTKRIVNTDADATFPPNIETDFAMAVRMPITTGDQPASSEQHDIQDADFTETQTKLGKGNLTNRHAECTDCHNPHRLRRTQLFSDTPSSGVTEATHLHATNQTHSNIISGALRGTWGVEPSYLDNSFFAMPSSFTVKKGDPGTSAATGIANTYVTREYQICLKCHSNYGYDDNNLFPTGNRPNLTNSTGGTTSGTNSLTQFTNQGREFQAPSTHACEPCSVGNDGGAGGGTDTNYNTNNHRSWHPVMDATGRTLAKRGMTAGDPWSEPWDGQIGTVTMYCTDCHGSSTTGNDVIPDAGGQVWGPHGSSNNFLLKGTWDNESGSTNADVTPTTNLLCIKCHEAANYMGRSDQGETTGFFNSSRGNLHNYHADKVARMECTWCHVAVPHGWKNKSFLVNLNDVGEEAGLGAGSSKEWNMNAPGQAYTQEPYYIEAKLKVHTFAQAGSWSETDCGSRNRPSGERFGTNGNNTQTGKSWMIDACGRDGDQPP